MCRRFSMIDSRLLLLVLFKCEHRKVRCDKTANAEASGQTEYRTGKQYKTAFCECFIGGDP
jgi:hypothetical protein